MKKTIILLAMAAVLLTACQETLEERCAREAKEYTEKHCPVAVAKEIIMDSMTFDKATHTLSYIYTVKGALDDAAVINNGQSRELLLQQVRNATNLKLYKEAGYSFRYIYYSAQKKGTRLFDTTFHDTDYR